MDDQELQEPKDREYRSGDIQRFGIKRSEIVHWIETGVILPLEDVRGRGKSRRFSHQNLIEALICRELSKFRIETTRMRHVMTVLREGSPIFRPLWERLNKNRKILEEDHLLVIPASSPFSDARMGLGPAWPVLEGLVQHRLTAAIVINISNLITETGGW